MHLQSVQSGIVLEGIEDDYGFSVKFKTSWFFFLPQWTYGSQTFTAEYSKAGAGQLVSAKAWSPIRPIFAWGRFSPKGEINSDVCTCR